MSSLWITRREASPQHILTRHHHRQAVKGSDFPLSTASAIARSNELGSLGFLNYTCMRVTKHGSVRSVSKVAMIAVA